MDDMQLDNDVAPPKTKRPTPASRATKAKAAPQTSRAKAGSKARGKKVATDEDEDEDEIISFDQDEEEEEVRPKKSRVTASRWATFLRLFLFHHDNHIAVLHQRNRQRRRKAPRVLQASYLPVEDQELPLTRRRRFVVHVFPNIHALMMALDRDQRI